MNNGWIKIPREILNDDFFFDSQASKKEAVVDLFSMTAYKPSSVVIRGIDIQLKVGQVAVSVNTLHERWKWGKDKVSSFLKELESRSLITIQRSKLVNIITVTSQQISQQNVEETSQQKTQNTSQQNIQTPSQQKKPINTVLLSDLSEEARQQIMLQARQQIEAETSQQISQQISDEASQHTKKYKNILNNIYIKLKDIYENILLEAVPQTHEFATKDDIAKYMIECIIKLGQTISADKSEIESLKSRLEELNNSKQTIEEKRAAAEKRKNDFRESLKPYIQTYGEVMVINFFEYWSEFNKTKTKMKFEQERTWELPLRLKKWNDNNNKWHSNGQHKTNNGLATGQIHPGTNKDFEGMKSENYF